MKKVYFMAFIATAALTVMSCSNDDITTGGDLSKNEATAINFSTYLGRNVETRAGETTSENIKTSGFGVFASYTTSGWSTAATSNFMFNQSVTNSEGNWTYSPVKYWTSEGKFSFFAYAPYATDDNGIATSSNNTTAGAPVLKIMVPTDHSKMIDFVAANAMNKTYSSSESGEVKFTLKHEMTRAAFKATKATTVDSKTTVTVKNITLKSKKLYTTATYTFASDASSKGSWTPTELTSDNSISLSNLSLTGDVTSPYLYLIPVAELGENDVTAEITYEVKTEDDKLAGGSVTTTGKKEVKLPASSLQQGKSYLFTLTVSLDEIKLTATVDANWDADSSESNTISVGGN